MKETIAKTLGVVERVYNLIDNSKHENALFVIYARDG